MLQVCRREWEESSLRQDAGFDVNQAALTINADFLDRARGLFDLANPKKAHRFARTASVEEPVQSAKGSGKGGNGASLFTCPGVCMFIHCVGARW